MYFLNDLFLREQFAKNWLSEAQIPLCQLYTPTKEEESQVTHPRQPGSSVGAHMTPLAPFLLSEGARCRKDGTPQPPCACDVPFIM